MPDLRTPGLVFVEFDDLELSYKGGKPNRGWSERFLYCAEEPRFSLPGDAHLEQMDYDMSCVLATAALLFSDTVSPRFRFDPQTGAEDIGTPSGSETDEPAADNAASATVAAASAPDNGPATPMAEDTTPATDGQPKKPIKEAPTPAAEAVLVGDAVSCITLHVPSLDPFLVSDPLLDVHHITVLMSQLHDLYSICNGMELLAARVDGLRSGVGVGWRGCRDPESDFDVMPTHPSL